MKIKIGDAIELNNALRELDGHTRVVKVGDAEQIVRESYKLTGPARRKIAQNLAKLRPELQAHQEAINGLWRQIADGKDALDEKKPDEAVKIAEFKRQVDAMAKEEIEIDFRQLQESDLGLDQNPIPVSVLSSIEQIMD